MAGTSVGEFFLSLVVDTGKGELTIGNLVAQMGELEVASVGEIAILAELAQKLAMVTDHAIQTSLGLEHIAVSTGVSMKALQEWRNVADFVKISASTLDGVVESVSHNLVQMSYSGKAGGLADLNVLLQGSGKTLWNFVDPKTHKADALGLLKLIREIAAARNIQGPLLNTMLGSSGIQPLLDMLMKSRISDEQWKEYTSLGPVITDDQIQKYDLISRDLTEILHTTEAIGLAIANWFSDDTLAILHAVAGVFKMAKHEVDLIGGAKSAPSDWTKDPLGGLLQHLPFGAELNKMRMAYGAVGAGLLGVSDTDNPFTAVSTPRVPDYLGRPESTGPKSVTVHAPVTINGTRLSKMELSDAIHMAFQGLPPLLNNAGF